MKNKLRYFRLICGEITQAELAKKINVSRQTIIAIEKGNYNPSVLLAMRLAKILETTVENLFILEDEE